MKRLHIVVLAFAVLDIAPLFAASSASVQSFPRPFVAPAATSPGIIATTITIGERNVPYVPCLNCVSGASIGNVGLAVPLSTVLAGSAMAIVLTADDVAYTGPCTFSYAIRVTATSSPIQTDSVSADCYPAIWWAFLGIQVPSAPGRYLLQGSIKQGNAKSVIDSSLIIQ